MSENMDSAEKKYFTEKLDDLKDDIKEVKQENKESHARTDKHLEKTCDEIGKIDEKQDLMGETMIRFEGRLDNHLKISEKEDNKKKQKVSIDHNGS